MSTKNLARTVIEGGRAGYNKFERRHSNATQRTREREIEQALLNDADRDEYAFPCRETVYRGFADKLSPAERWLERQIDRPWNKVQSEMFQRFDTRTTAGRHIVFCHLLRMVDLGTDGSRWYRYEIFVDAYGILRRARHRHRVYASPERRAPLPEPRQRLLQFLSGRRVAQVGSHFYWYTPTAAGRFRQYRELNADEEARWRRVPAWFREEHDPCAPPTESTAACPPSP
ncbi:MAG TPA: hypothetical protein VI072_15735 [Polyangiaceae bacterium]